MKASSKPSGGRIPVPAAARTFVSDPLAVDRKYAAAIFGLTDTTASAGIAGRGLYGSSNAPIGSRWMSSIRKPAVTNSRPAAFQRASLKYP